MKYNLSSFTFVRFVKSVFSYQDGDPNGNLRECQFPPVVCKAVEYMLMSKVNNTI